MQEISQLNVHYMAKFIFLFYYRLRLLMFCFLKLFFCNTRTLRGQTVHFVNYKRIPQQTKIRFIVESATLLFFFDLLCCFGFHVQIATTLYCSKLLQNRQLCGIHDKMRGIRNQLHSVKRENDRLYYNYNRTFRKIIINCKHPF